MINWENGVMVIERDNVRGTWPNWGCNPSKNYEESGRKAGAFPPGDCLEVEDKRL